MRRDGFSDWEMYLLILIVLIIKQVVFCSNNPNVSACVYILDDVVDCTKKIKICDGWKTEYSRHRTWVCKDNGCSKNSTADPANAVSINECKATCLQHGGLWPRPSGNHKIGKTTTKVNVTSITFERNELPTEAEHLVMGAQTVFLNRILGNSEKEQPVKDDETAYEVKIFLEIYDPSVLHFTTDTDESYKLHVALATDGSKTVQIALSGNNFFGVRHGLETITQLFIYDDIHQVYKILNEVDIEDKPVYKHRGIALDTARSYITVDTILKTLDNMAANKLNTFHWHITDSQSFPYVSKSYPQLSQEGAYSAAEVYTEDDIKKIVDYGRVRGIRVVPEFDAPAHVGEGWEAVGADLVTCFKWEPWRDYCVEPPCGQFDPTNDRVYEVLGSIYKEYVDLFQSDLFHMGGDEVNTNCWQSTPRIVEWMNNNSYPISIDGFVGIWGLFQSKTYEKLKLTKEENHPQAILWTSTLTEPKFINKYLTPEDYIIQIWTQKNDNQIKDLLNRDFRLIFSNYDELYFDCGGPSWVGQPGNNWCSPYINWQQVYEHSPVKIVRDLGIEPTENIKKLLLGSEAALWVEQLDDKTIHSRLWPRAAALAERLWADPTEPWDKTLRYRINHHRGRLLKNNPIAEQLQPEWCYQNDGFCE